MQQPTPPSTPSIHSSVVVTSVPLGSWTSLLSFFLDTDRPASFVRLLDTDIDIGAVSQDSLFPLVCAAALLGNAVPTVSPVSRLFRSFSPPASSPLHSNLTRFSITYL